MDLFERQYNNQMRYINSDTQITVIDDLYSRPSGNQATYCFYKNIKLLFIQYSINNMHISRLHFKKFSGLVQSLVRLKMYCIFGLLPVHFWAMVNSPDFLN